MKSHIILKIVALMALLSFACLTTTATPTPELAGDELVPDFLTETSVPEVTTDTPIPEPTETPTLVPTETPVPADTAAPTPDLAATEAIIGTQAAEKAMSLVGDVLESLNLSTDSGSLAWVQDKTIVAKSNTYLELSQKPIDEGIVYEQYVLNVDIIWESTSGLAGCGITFHSENNIDKGKQYQFFALRLSGLPLWDVELWDNGQWQSTTTGDAKVNSAIDLGNGARNNYVLHMQKGLMTAYANGKRLSNVITSSLNKGRVAFFAYQESGDTTCTFENGWLWVLDK